MAGSKSDYLENEILDHVLGGADYSRPATVYIALYTAAPTDAGGGTEVTGGSYAGYLTAYLVGHDHRFQAAVAQRGVYDLAVFFGEGNAWRLVPWEFDAYPWEDFDILRKESPITYAHLIETPLLIIHSDRDLRTGVSQSRCSTARSRCWTNLWSTFAIRGKDTTCRARVSPG